MSRSRFHHFAYIEHEHGCALRVTRARGEDSRFIEILSVSPLGSTNLCLSLDRAESLAAEIRAAIEATNRKGRRQVQS